MILCRRGRKASLEGDFGACRLDFFANFSQEARGVFTVRSVDLGCLLTKNGLKSRK